MVGDGMDKIYAQVFLKDMSVNLIGGKEVGLPLNNLLVKSVYISNRANENIQIGMYYDQENDRFSFEKPLIFSKEQLLIDKYTLTLIRNDLLK